MSSSRPSKLRFNFGFFLESPSGTSREIELNYPTVWVAEDVTLTPLRGTFLATRTSEGVYVSGQLHSTLIVACMRCLQDAYLPITIELSDLFYYPPYMAPEGEYSIGEDGYADFAPLIRELSLLEVPIRPLCQPECKGLCDQCGQNLNESACDCERDDIDPRFAALRQLLE